MLTDNEIQDDYGTCRETFVTLRVFSEEISPDEVTRLLGLEPTRVTPKGRRHWSGWALSTEKMVDSRDNRRHLDWLLERLRPRQQALLELDAAGASTDLFCFWVSATGEGGPCLMPRQMRELAAMNLDISWNIYFGDEQLRVGRVSGDDGSPLLIAGDAASFEYAGQRLADGRSLLLMGGDVTLRLDPDDEGGHFDSNPQGTRYAWRMTPAEAAEAAERMIALSRRDEAARVELMPGQNRAGVRLLLSIGEYEIRQFV